MQRPNNSILFRRRGRLIREAIKLLALRGEECDEVVDYFLGAGGAAELARVELLSRGGG